MAGDPVATVSSDVEFRFAAPEDCDQIGSFLVELGGPLFTERFPGLAPGDLYRWKLFSSPWGAGITALATHRGRIVGMVAAVPKPMRFAGQTAKAFELGDFFVAPEFRRKGYFGDLIEMVSAEAAQRGGDLTYVRPNDLSFPLLVRRGFLELQQLHERHLSIPSRAVERRVPGSAGLVRALGGDALARRLSLPTPGPDAPLVEPVHRFGDEMDRLWERAAPHYDVCLVRSAQYLNWRFADSPAPFELWLARRGNEAAGFGVTFRSATGLGFLIDAFSLPADASAAGSIVRHTITHLLDRGCHSVYCWTVLHHGESALHQHLRRACPRLHQSVLHVAFRSLRDAALPPPSGTWHMSMGDFDGF